MDRRKLTKGEIMIRNANTLNGVADKSKGNKCFVSLVPVWPLNAGSKVTQGCSLTDLSYRGASILIPKAHDILPELFELVFMSPDNKDEILTSLQVEQRWKDVDISEDSITVGVEFQNSNPIMIQVVNAMIEVFNQKKHLVADNVSSDNVSSDECCYKQPLQRCP